VKDTVVIRFPPEQTMLRGELEERTRRNAWTKRRSRKHVVADLRALRKHRGRRPRAARERRPGRTASRRTTRAQGSRGSPRDDPDPSDLKLRSGGRRRADRRTPRTEQIYARRPRGRISGGGDDWKAA
jgi:hypothetical protein